MTRTTISLNEMVFRQVRVISQKEKRTLGEMISELISLGLKSFQERKRRISTPPAQFPSFSMGKPTVALEDKEALNKLLDES